MSAHRKKLRSATSYPAIVGAVLVALREREKRTQAYVAGKLELAASTWSRVERGTSGLSVSQVDVAADLLGVRPAEILDAADRIHVMLAVKMGVRVDSSPISPRVALAEGLAPLSHETLVLLARTEVDAQARRRKSWP